MYLDPPYLIGNYLYGNRGDTHKNFDHLLLRELVDSLDNGWVLSYNDCQEVRDLYKDYEIRPLEWAYSMNASKKSSEIVILG
jgi:DNA adenine methylase